MVRFLLPLLLLTLSVHAQFNSMPDYPKGYFRNPLNVAIDLSGNFGELRPNHYHMGLDLKTLRRENLQVYAAAEGFISRVKIEPSGFGRAIYISHPNGLTTVYCHLNDFFPELENWVKQQQYEKESWALNIELSASLFPVKKGSFIAFSGNTGGSQAPHLHFEIRRTSDDVNLNPMLFGFELADNTRPSILRLAVYDRTKSIYEQSPRLIPVTSKGNGIYTTAPITVSVPKVSLAISAFDTHTGSSNQNGIFEAILLNNDSAVVGFRMDQISYDATRYLNAHIDYATKSRGGPFLQHLTELPGYLNSIYHRYSGDGVIDLSDGQPHNLAIVARDAYGNSSTVTTVLRYNGSRVQHNDPAGKKFYPLMVDVFESEDCEFIIGERTLYDSVTIGHQKKAQSPGAISAIHTIGSLSVPLQDSMIVRIKPLNPVPPADQDRVVMLRTGGSRKDVQKVSWQHDWAMARFRDFGSFALVTDHEPPVIQPVGFGPGSNLAAASRLAFTVSDNLGRTKVLRTELDGKWLRFSNDKGRTYIYKFDELCGPGAHTLKITAQDEAGNITEREINFVR
ncbi:M23 family metallopeptidase [Flavihumibacter solisilvae]|uniref:M23ase beta-sheet core domain-containing protein n=1 Tax=Flavihumibacter solisilvae TaxID=1349421 RepID=A0A0C1L7D1_9BACT|nr:M23 family metallopeptidase [Flavihumibacter solisilvae]KIC96067.1 hypothetical protein OI18_02510 [Flavihumibacter solisilvae]